MKKNPKLWAVGVMTGTSCDGADIAALLMSADQGKLVHAKSAKFPKKLRTQLLEAQKGKTPLAQAFELEKKYSDWLGNLLSAFLRKNKIPVSNCVIGVHGQTVWHAPERGFTVQLVDAARISAKTGATVVSKFRNPDLAAHGQGAPLVPYYHWLKLQPLRSRMPMAVFNVGGIANVTFVTENQLDLVAFDTGPGNALIDLAVKRMSSKEFDTGGKIAQSALARVDWKKIQKIASLPYFRKKAPKSTGREFFNEEFLKRFGTKGAQLVADATALTAYTMAASFDLAPKNVREKLKLVWIAGGGAENPTLVKLFGVLLSSRLHRSIDVEPMPKAVAPTQYLEAMAFAHLAVLGLRGEPVSLPQVTGAKFAASGAGIFPGKDFRSLLQTLDMV